MQVQVCCCCKPCWVMIGQALNPTTCVDLSLCLCACAPRTASSAAADAAVVVAAAVTAAASRQRETSAAILTAAIAAAITADDAPYSSHEHPQVAQSLQSKANCKILQ